MSVIFSPVCGLTRTSKANVSPSLIICGADEREMAAERFAGDAANVAAVEGDDAGDRIIEAKQQIQDGSFPAARGATQCNCLAGV